MSIAGDVSQTELGHLENGRYVYRFHRSPMCDYMINFILKLKQLPEKYMMNSVLENFTILQVGNFTRALPQHFISSSMFFSHPFVTPTTFVRYGTTFFFT